MDLATFRSWHPEFRAAGDPLVQLHLDQATSEVDPTVFAGSFADKAIRLKAAHSLAMTPYGRSARLVADDGTTVYETELEELARSCAQNIIVV